MRLYKRGQIWWVAFDRVRRRSLKTRDEKEAQRIFKALEREHLAGRLIKLDRGSQCHPWSIQRRVCKFP